MIEAMQPKPKRGEYLFASDKTKDVYYFNDDKEGIDVRSREVYKKKPLEIHYPFDRRGGHKYKFIEVIEYWDIEPSSINGVYKSANFGLGFTKNLSPVLYQLERFPRLKKVVVSSKLDSKLTPTEATFSTADLESAFRYIKPLKESQSEELKQTANNALADIFKGKIEPSNATYHKGQLRHFLKSKNVTSEKLSTEDVGEIIKVIPDKIPEESLLFKAEEKINFIRLSAVKREFAKLIKQKMDTKSLEERCQKFFDTNSWIFSNVLSAPVALVTGKAYVGGKTFDNKHGKVTDFLYKNNLTHNAFVIEIKTPRKKLFDSKTPYRKPDIFSPSKELTGGLVQVLDQKDTLQKDFNSTVKADAFESFNPKALLVIGCLTDIDKKQVKSFELFRSNLKDVEIITYDELLERTNLILGQFVEDTPKPKAKAKKKKKRA